MAQWIHILRTCNPEVGQPLGLAELWLLLKLGLAWKPVRARPASVCPGPSGRPLRILRIFERALLAGAVASLKPLVSVWYLVRTT
ncbi:MAG TPA: hypothetical protein PLC99_14025 [Verrucomicrobiota bacterium]|nr:hypothetical protein [Verrucomicrobiota bacterium]